MKVSAIDMNILVATAIFLHIPRTAQCYLVAYAILRTAKCSIFTVFQQFCFD